MGWLDSLFSNEPQASRNEAPSGWLGPLVGAPTPPDRAQQPQGVPPPQGVGPQGPSLLDRLTAGATNLTTGGNPLAGLLNSVNGLATGQRTDRAGVELAHQQATMLALMNAGLDADRAHAAAVNPDFLRALVVAHYGTRSTRDRAARTASNTASSTASSTAPDIATVRKDEPK